jgi:hypothetical protein
MAWSPVFSPDGNHVAAKVEKNGHYRIVFDGKTHQASYSALWNPVFSPDGEKLMIRGIEKDSQGEKYYRHIIPVSEF